MRIVFLNYEFNDSRDEIVSASCATYQSMLGDMLAADDFTFTVRYSKSIYGNNLGDFEDFVYATPVSIYDGDTLLYKFYATNIAAVAVEQDGRIQFKFDCVSFVGLTINQEHKGGMYVDSTFGSIVADVLNASYTKTEESVKYYTCASGLAYAIDKDLAETRVDGHLPIATARDNLRDVIEQCGCSILKQADGTIHFTYNFEDEPIGIDANKIYIGDKYADIERVTKVMVTEHTFFQVSSTEAEEIYDGTEEVLENAVIKFDAPMYGLTASEGLEIDEDNSNCNYATVSGSGILYGKPYMHSRRQIAKSTGLSGTENIKQIDDNELVSQLTSGTLLSRLKNYYSTAKEVNMSFVTENGIKTGSFISFLDVLNNLKTGYISEMQVIFSGINKAVTRVITNWTPSDIGPEKGYTTFDTLTGSGTYTVPSGVSRIKAVIIQGGNGGYGGYQGESLRSSYDGHGGDGGNVGEGGTAGKVYQIDIDVTEGQSFSYSVGGGGNAGAKNHGAGSEGSHSTFGQYSSSMGAVATSGFLNVINQQLYATEGPAGLCKGAKGGHYNYPTGVGMHRNGYDVTYNGVAWSGGRAGENDGKVGGGSGGGAAYGANGGNGADADGRPGIGGDGASASFVSQPLVYGQGGAGGNGGGGAGCGGIYSSETSVRYGGYGGDGSVGGQGASGVIFVYR